MNIDDLTVGQVKEIAGLINGNTVQSTPVEKNPAIGKYCIVRCRNAGVHAGIVKQANAEFVELENSRRMWRWKTDFTLSEAAVNGINASESKIAVEVETLIIPLIDVAELIPASKKAQKTIESAETYKV